MVMVNTDEAEGAQALFCYIADYLGLRKTRSSFKPYYESKDVDGFFEEHKKIIDEAFSSGRVDTSKPKRTIISYIKKNKDWFLSSMQIAEEILTQVDDISGKFRKVKSPGWQNLFYAHGDDDVMKTISELFKSANIQSAKMDGTKYFGDLNKWSPADIYFASQKAKSRLLRLKNHEQTRKNNLTFAILNETIGELIESGDLLPLSLKKVSGNVSIHKVNFDRKSEETLLAKTECTGIQKWEEMKGNYEFKNGKFKMHSYSGGRDIYITLKSDKKSGRIQIRHTPASGGKPSKGVKVILSYRGSSALGGQVVGIPLFTKIIETVDPVFATKLRSVWDGNYAKFARDANRYIINGGGSKKYKSGDKKQKNKFNDDMGAISGLTVMNPLREEIDKYFKNPKEKQHNVVRAIFAYTASRTELSSPFVIAKD